MFNYFKTLFTLYIYIYKLHLFHLHLLMDYRGYWWIMKHCARIWFSKFWFILFYFVMLSGWSAFYEKDSSRCWGFKHLSRGVGVLGSNCSCLCQVVSRCVASRTGWSPDSNQVKSIRASFAFFLSHFSW